LETEQALHVVEEITELQPQWLLLEGGEPFLREDLYTILQSARALGLRVEVITNGQEKMDFERLQAEEVRVSVSLEAVGEGYGQLRKGGDFERLIRNLEGLSANGLLGDLILTLHSRSEPASVVELASRLECGITVLGYKPKDRSDPLLMEKPQYREELEFLSSLAGKLGVRISADEPFYHLLADSQPSAPVVPEVQGCIFGRYLFINADGAVKPCTFAPSSIGRADDLRAVWERWLESPLFEEISRKVRRGKCGKCRFLSVCGGCRSRAAVLTGDMLGEDPLCPL
jgi:radical SAM protein with 4Fe4S-binding SPASM domain